MSRIDVFQPDWVSAPGDTMVDILEEHNLSLVEFAQRMGHTLDHANELVHGRATITMETAQNLERVLGASAAFWMNREIQYREDFSRLQPILQNAANKDWLSELPVKDMIEFEWISAARNVPDKVTACLRFFDVPDVGTWRENYRDMLSVVSFRTSPTFESQPGAVLAWLRQGEIESAEIDCNSWDASEFESSLSVIRSLTRKKNPKTFLPELRKVCASCGVAVVMVRAPKGCRASGATRFLSPNKALILLSFRYLSDDQFWFSFFHEAAHLLLHDNKALFLEDDSEVTAEEEDEANEFAARILIPPKYQSALSELRLDAREMTNARNIMKLAKRVGVSPGIVVGQLQHMKRIQPSRLNKLKKRFNWEEIVA